MRKILFLLMAVCVAVACDSKQPVAIAVTNPSSFDRDGELVEVLMSEVSAKLQLPDTAQFVVLDEVGQQVPYQLTYDGKLIFSTSVKANATANYVIQAGEPLPFDTKACGRYYPERVDDVAWENDLVAFRTYGPALQASGERAFGYDVWLKYKTTEPVVEARYAMELNPETLAQIDSLKKIDPKAAAELRAATSYHVDHGNGLDCYKVGPTLGGGTAALMVSDSLIYPKCYKTQEILDNGPLRFTVKLVYDSQLVKGENAVETRIISLDAGSHFNKTVLSYANLTQPTSLAVGIVLHEKDGVFTTDAAKGFITYVDPTDNVNNNNGKIFVGAAFPIALNEAKAVYFPEKEKKELRGGAEGHVLAVSEYLPGSEFTYYWGAGWSKADIKDAAAWDAHVANFAQKVQNPLTVVLK